MEIKTENICKSYKGIKVVKGVSVKLKKGEIVGLLGPNGAGKTTTFDMIVGLISPETGEVYHNNNKITNLHFQRRLRILFSTHFSYQEFGLSERSCRRVRKKVHRDRAVYLLEAV